MDEVIRLLQAEITEALSIKSKYEEIQLLNDIHLNEQVGRMIQHYDNRIKVFEKACSVLKASTKKKPRGSSIKICAGCGSFAHGNS